MKYATFGRTGMEISRVVFGGIVTTNEDQKDADRYVAWARDRGVNYFDVAPTYGDAQLKLGEALRPYRQQSFLACKTAKRMEAEAREQLEESLRLLHTEYFDVYQFHSLTTEEDIDQVFGPGGALEAVVRAKEKGYVRFIGFSAHNEDIALKALELFNFDSVLFPVNWALDLGKGFGSRITAKAKELGKGLLGMKTLAHRQWLEGEERVYPKSWCKTVFNDDRLAIAALKYTLSKGVDTVVPPGNFEQFAYAVEHIEECLAHPLTAEDVAYLKGEVEKIDGKHFF